MKKNCGRVYKLLLIMGTLAIIAAVIGMILVEWIVPDIEGSDPQKDQYFFGWMKVGVVGIALLCSGGFGLLISLEFVKREPRGFPVELEEKKPEE